MPKGIFEFKYATPQGKSYPKKGLVREVEKDGEVIVAYNRRLLDAEIQKHNLRDLNHKVGKLATLREQAGKKQKEMAAELGIASKSLQRYEQYGAEQATLGCAIKIADYLGVNVRDLVDW